MPLYLVPPGKRKRNRFYLIRGEVAGQRIEISSKTTDETAARRLKAKLEIKLLKDRVPEPGEAITFSQATDIYKTFKQLVDADDDAKRLKKICAVIGQKLVGDLRHVDLVNAAEQLYAGRAPATKNRNCMSLAAMVLHHAARNNFCPYLRIELFDQPRPRTRSVSIPTARTILNSLPTDPPKMMGNRPPTERELKRHADRQEKKQLLILWLFRQGNRISDVLKIRWEGIDLARRVVVYHVGKADRPDVEKPLHDEVWEILASKPQLSGWLFPWRTRSGVYKWLRPYTKALGIKFTPHMARHSVGKWLNEEGASLRTIMDTLDHEDAKSSIRYQSTDVEALRKASGRLGKLVPK